MKKVLLNDQAQRMYVEDLMTFEAIAAEIDVSERTLRNWAKEGNWDMKRKKYMKFQENLQDDAREIAGLLAQKIKEQLGEGKEPANHLLFSFTRIASSLIKIREYEKTVAAEEARSESSEKETAQNQKNAAAIFKETFGVDLNY